MLLLFVFKSLVLGKFSRLSEGHLPKNIRIALSGFHGLLEKESWESREGELTHWHRSSCGVNLIKYIAEMLLEVGEKHFEVR